MPATRKAPFAVACVLLAIFAACSRKHESEDFLPSAPAVQNALRILLEAASIPADGASTVRIEAQISANADPDKRTIRFKTTLGSWFDGTVDANGNPVDQGQEVEREADSSGKAVAFLKAAKTAGVAVITVSVLDADDQPLATVSGEVTFTVVEDVLMLTVSGQGLADGATPVDLEATISDTAPAEWNKVVFTTDFGRFVGADAASPKTKTVDTDSQRKARAQLTSFEIGTATVTAKVMQFESAVVTQLVDFGARNEQAIQIESPDTVPADGASQINVSALLAPRLEGKQVTFTTSAGQFVSGSEISSDKKTAKASADASRRATVRLQSGETIQEVLLTASIDLDDNAATTTLQTVQKLINFVRALPDFIQVSANPPGPLTVAQAQTTITAQLTRDLGKVSPNTVVDYTVTENDGTTPVADMEVIEATRSTAVGGVQTSTAKLTFGSATVPVGGKVVIVKATVAGSGVSGSVSILIQP